MPVESRLAVKGSARPELEQGAGEAVNARARGRATPPPHAVDRARFFTPVDTRVAPPDLRGIAHPLAGWGVDARRVAVSASHIHDQGGRRAQACLSDQAVSRSAGDSVDFDDRRIQALVHLHYRDAVAAVPASIARWSAPPRASAEPRRGFVKSRGWPDKDVARQD